MPKPSPRPIQAASHSSALATGGWALLAAAGSGLLWFASEFEIDTRPVAPRPSATADAAAADAAKLQAESLTRGATPSPKPLSAFAETLARPVFEPSRRPRPRTDPAAAVPETNSGAPPPSAEGFKFVGLMKTAKGEPRALLRSPDQPLGAWVAKGGDVSGWTVREIGERQVVLETQATRVEIKLYSPDTTATRSAH